MTTGDVGPAARDPDETERHHETYTLVDALTRGQRRRVDELDAKYDGVLGGLDARLGARLGLIDTRLDQVDGRLVGVEARIDGLEERVTARLETLEATMRELLSRLPADR